MRQITTYERLDRHIKSWANGSLPYLCVTGKGGLGKTHAYETALGDRPHHLFRGRVSGFQMFTDVRQHPDWPIVFDDVRRLMTDPEAVDMMKQLAETKPHRTIRWKTNAITDGNKEFVCTGNVLVVLNSVPKNNADVEAILDRFDVIEFAPTKPEVIDQMRLFAADQADVDLLAGLPATPSLRTLIKFEQWKLSEVNAEEELLAECGVSEDVVRVMNIMERFPKSEWIRNYQDLTGKNYEAAKRDWARKKGVAAQLLEAGTKAGTPPPCPDVPAALEPQRASQDLDTGTKGQPDGDASALATTPVPDTHKDEEASAAGGEKTDDPAVDEEKGLISMASQQSASDEPTGSDHNHDGQETEQTSGRHVESAADADADETSEDEEQDEIAKLLGGEEPPSPRPKRPVYRPRPAKKTASHKMSRTIAAALRKLEDVADLDENGLEDDSPYDRAGPLRSINESALAIARIGARLSEKLQPSLEESQRAVEEERARVAEQKEQEPIREAKSTPPLIQDSDTSGDDDEDWGPASQEEDDCLTGLFDVSPTCSNPVESEVA